MGIPRLLCALPLLAACGGDMSGLTGVYDINSWTDNPTACDVEGPASGNTETALYVKEENFIGTKFLNVNACTDVAECETLAADDDTINIGNWGFTDGNDDDGWVDSNAYAFTNFDDPTKCDATGSETIMTSPAEGMLRIERRTTHSAEPYPATGPNDDPCPDAGAEAAVQGQPCDSLEVVTATFNEPLP
ncbi:MAG TPA: hypothetical protein VL172_14000 [Kofleriaceae bacterium]|nr:hypothetical protein [Kofleriaceae bacterium]